MLSYILTTAFDNRAGGLRGEAIRLVAARHGPKGSGAWSGSRRCMASSIRRLRRFYPGQAERLRRAADRLERTGHVVSRGGYLYFVKDERVVWDDKSF